MNTQQAIDELLSSVDASKQEQFRLALQKNLSDCISASVSSRAKSESLTSRIGGPALLPEAIEHPLDKAGKPLLFLALLNFAELPDSELSIQRKGLLFVFWNQSRDFSNPKDRSAFRILWSNDNVALMESPYPAATIGPAVYLQYRCEQSLPECESAWTDEVVKEAAIELAGKIQKHRKLQILGQAGTEFDRLQEIAAFAGNGVSWSPARSLDSCYSHLVESARSWRLFLKMDSLPEAGLDLGARSMYLLIREDDLAKQQYDKSWLLVS